jgi:hypothetical protein
MNEVTLIGVLFMGFMILLALFARYERIYSEQERNRAFLLIKRYDQAIEPSHKDHTLYIYDCIDSKVLKDTQAKLREVNHELALKIESHFGIDLKEYGIKIRDESITFKN